MASAATKILTFPAKLCSFAGAIFTKELRTSSRRKRYYLLRAAYVAFLTLFVVGAWLSFVRWDTHQSAAYRISRMPEAGKNIISTILWFQFIGGQLLAVILLSTSISGEVYNRTLPVLMTTPLSTFQIVFGKLLSKVLPLTILLAVSLPLMAVVRVFGGVPWRYVVSGLAISFTAALLVGAITMFFSALFRRAYTTILVTLGACFVLYFVVPWILAMVAAIAAIIAGPTPLMVMMYFHPFAAMGYNTVAMLDPTVSGQMMFIWPLHCLLMLGMTGGILALCTRLLGRFAFARAFGGPGPVAPAPAPVRTQAGPPRPAPPGAPVAGTTLRSGASLRAYSAEAAEAASAAKAGSTSAAVRRAGRVRDITGSPLIWRELRSPLFRNLTARVVFIALAGALLLVTYLICAVAEFLVYGAAHAVYVSVFVAAGAVATSVLSATSITSEKESRCLPLLLTTPLTDAHIIWAKALGVARRCLPIWGILIAHVVFFCLFLCIHPVALLHLAMLTAGLLAFLMGTGLYFGARLRKTTSAVVSNFGLAVALWALLPYILGMLGGLVDWSGIPVLAGAMNHLMSMNPMYQAWMATWAAGGTENAARAVGQLGYYWFGHSYVPSGAGAATLRIFLYMVAHGAVGLLCAWRAVRRLRRNVF